MKEDKIFNNKFNSGDIEYELFGNIKIKDGYIDKDVHDNYVKSQLESDIYDIFLESEYYEEMLSPKKITKNDAIMIFYYFDERLPNNNEISHIDKFIGLADFIGIPYEVLYKELGPSYKEKILKELDAKYQIFSKKKIKRLF